MFSRKKLQHVAILRIFKIFSENSVYFSKKNKFWTFWEFVLFQSHCTVILLQFSEKKISRSETWTNIVLVWTQLANIQTSEIAHLSWRFCFHIFKRMAQNNNAKTIRRHKGILVYFEASKRWMNFHSGIETSAFESKTSWARINQLEELKFLVSFSHECKLKIALEFSETKRAQIRYFWNIVAFPNFKSALSTWHDLYVLKRMPKYWKLQNEVFQKLSNCPSRKHIDNIDDSLMLWSITSLMRQFYLKHRKHWWLFDVTSMFHPHFQVFSHLGKRFSIE